MEEEEYQTNNTSNEETSKTFKYIIFGVIFVIVLIFGVAIYFLANNSSKIISEQDLNLSKQINLSEGQKVNFILLENKHSLTLDKINENSVEITIQSTPIKITLTIGEEREIDINSDGIADLYIRLERIEGGESKLIIRKAIKSEGQGTIPEQQNNIGSQNQQGCTENWSCTSWGSCMIDGQSRTCTDINNCGTTNNKPLTTQTCCYIKCYNWTGICSEFSLSKASCCCCSCF